MDRSSWISAWRSLVPRAFNHRWNPHQKTKSEEKHKAYTITIEMQEYPQNLNSRRLEVWLKNRKPENTEKTLRNRQNRARLWRSIFIIGLWIWSSPLFLYRGIIFKALRDSLVNVTFLFVILIYNKASTSVPCKPESYLLVLARGYWTAREMNKTLCSSYCNQKRRPLVKLLRWFWKWKNWFLIKTLDFWFVNINGDRLLPCVGHEVVSTSNLSKEHLNHL